MYSQELFAASIWRINAIIEYIWELQKTCLQKADEEKKQAKFSKSLPIICPVLKSNTHCTMYQ